MAIDLIHIGLAIVIVLLAVAIYTLLRTMSSPYIKRFEMVVKGKMMPLKSGSPHHLMTFNFNGREFELYEINHEPQKGQNTVYNNFVFLKVKTKTDFHMVCLDIIGKVQVKAVLDDVLGKKHDIPPLEFLHPSVDVFYRDFKVLTTDQDKTMKICSHRELRERLADYKARFGLYGYYLPLAFEPGGIVLDYSLAAIQLNELVDNPRAIVKHATFLQTLADLVEGIVW